MLASVIMMDCYEPSDSELVVHPMISDATSYPKDAARPVGKWRGKKEQSGNTRVTTSICHSEESLAKYLLWDIELLHCENVYIASCTWVALFLLPCPTQVPHKGQPVVPLRVDPLVMVIDSSDCTEIRWCLQANSPKVYFDSPSPTCAKERHAETVTFGPSKHNFIAVRDSQVNPIKFIPQEGEGQALPNFKAASGRMTYWPDQGATN
ncbi:hypothetical protein C8R43DRAFT_948484 [Mycena crocata]|nr:hypothetical protein C8R43DRAFT_948484 [Mycena crocata]